MFFCIKMKFNQIIRQKLTPKYNAKSNVRIFKSKKPVQPQESRFNDVEIQMLPRSLYEQIFKKFQIKENDVDSVKKFKSELNRFGIELDKSPKFENVDLKLPKIIGNNLIEHFFHIAKQQIEPYEDLITSILSCHVPDRPKIWSFDEGWTKYDSKTGTSVKLHHPDDNVLIFDVETCVHHGSHPIIATALGKTNWYSWVSKDLHNQPESPASYSISQLIPLESSPNDTGYNLTQQLKSPKIVVGHNVSFDRARIKEQYWLESTGMRFLDTMSLHVCVSGVTSYQRAMLKSHKEMSADDLGWSEQTSLNNLTDTYKLYCDGELSKEPRNIFVEGDLQDIRDNFQDLVSYCSSDVEATFNILKVLYPLFKERFQHPATLAGMLEIGSAYLPINNNWERYKKDSDLSYDDLNTESKYLLTKRADAMCKLIHNEAYKKDLWMWDQDWSVQPFKLKKTPNKPNEGIKIDFDHIKENKILTDSEKTRLIEFETKFAPFIARTALSLPARRPLLSGYPTWYRKMCEKPSIDNWKPGPINISTGMQVVPKLLHLCWEGYPLHYIREQGWGFIVPYKDSRDSDDEIGMFPLEELIQKCPVVQSPDIASQQESEEAFGTLWKDVEIDLSKKNYWSSKKKKKLPYHNYKGAGVWSGVDIENCCWFFKLPHKDGVKSRVGNPLAKDFLNKFSDNVLSGEGDVAMRVIDIARMLSYWRNNRDRIHGQMAVWLDTSSSLPEFLTKTDQIFGAIIPQVVVCGTLTRRAMEPTWMTASNAQRERIGSELRAMIQAPPGYKIVGADVDSQELWIASILGDASATGIHGATPLGWMTLSGSKSSGTDMHSVTAQAVGISRDHAKVINYARIYGAGQNFAERLLKQFNPLLTDGEAKSKAMKMFQLTKGKKLYYLKKGEDDDCEGKGYTGYEALKLAAGQGKGVSEMFLRPKWSGGTESAMFNRLEEIAEQQEPVTPFLESRLSRALEPQGNTDDRFLPTRINWVVQSGAVDFLHLMLVCMRWLMGSNIRFCLSFHDELRYLVKDEHAYHAALAMHVTNLLTRSFCSVKIGLNDLPLSVAFFTAVEVDTVLRKESQLDCKTPSNPHGLQSGYGIQPGESLDIYKAIEKAGGSDLEKWKWHTPDKVKQKLKT